MPLIIKTKINAIISPIRVVFLGVSDVVFANPACRSIRQYVALKNNFLERIYPKYLAKPAHILELAQFNHYQHTKTLKSGLGDGLYWRMLSMSAENLSNHLPCQTVSS